MRKKLIISLLLTVICASSVWGAGRKDNISRQAADTDGFTDTIYTGENKPGKYNFYYEAKDKAGNIKLAGPENIFIDPESDLPRVTIINPAPDMHVRGNLNLVGSAIDDDGVDRVEFTISRGKDGKGQAVFHDVAEGKEFWTYFLDTTDESIWTDGVYTITAWSVDINGLSGISEKFPAKVHKSHKIYWNLDRKKPQTSVSSHELGALVSGNIRLRGEAIDGNGIESLLYSTDDGKKYSKVSLKLDKRTNINQWEISLNTKTLEDGPAVIKFKATDGMGTTGEYNHLLFVNNSSPEVKIIEPLTGASVNGVFNLSLYANHRVGLKSLSWKIDKIGADFPLLIGNPWFSTDIDIRSLKTGSIDVEIKAVDVSGNVTNVKQKYKVDQNADLPVVTLLEPAAGIVLKDGALDVRGNVKDDDGVKSVLYSIDGAKEVEIPCPSGYFQFNIPEIKEGAHIFEIWAKDITGVTGPKVQVKNITVPAEKPQPRIGSFTFGSGKTAVVKQYYTGLVIDQPKEKTPYVMEFTVKAATFAQGSVKFGNFAEIPVKSMSAKDGLFRANVNVPVNLPNGFLKIELRATDKNGVESVWDEYVYVGNSYNTGFRWIRCESDEWGRLLLKQNETITGLGDAPVSSAVLEGAPANNFELTVDSWGRVNLKVLNEGTFGPCKLIINDVNGQEFTSGEFTVIVDSLGVIITLLNSNEYEWVQNTVSTEFNVTSSSTLSSVDYSLDLGKTWFSVIGRDDAVKFGQKVNTSGKHALDLSGAEDGSIFIILRAVNELGQQSFANFTVLKDTQSPQASLVMPISGASMNGTMRIGFSIKENGLIKTITYSRPASTGKAAINKVVYPAENWTKEYPPMFLEIEMDSIEMPLDNTMVFSFQDEAGNTFEINEWDFIIDNEADIPAIIVNLPEDNEVITADFAISGVMYDDDAIKQIYWKIDDSEYQTLEVEYGFFIPIAFRSLADNEHTFTLIAEDIYGVKCEAYTQKFRVSLEEPRAAVIFPTFETVLRGTIEIKGVASDKNDIDKVEVSLNNGNSFNLAYGTTEWSYIFNSIILEDGPNVAFVRVYDKYGIQAMYTGLINIDNTKPNVILDGPSDGLITTGKISVVGPVYDPNLVDISLNLRGIEGQAVPPEMASRNLGPVSIIKEQFDLQNYKDGLYNIEIVAADKAGNISRVSRNIKLARQELKNTVDILYPLEYENVNGTFNLYGNTIGTDIAEYVTIYINGDERSTEKVTDAGYFRFSLNRSQLAEGLNEIIVRSDFGTGTVVESPLRHIYYSPSGPWVTIDSMNIADFAFERPYFYGRVGYELSNEDIEILADKKADKEEVARIKSQVPLFTELSFDNGRTFVKASGSLARDIDYRYRLETGEMAEGMHYILVRARMKSGETAVTRIIVQVDKTPPIIRLISPNTGEHYNTEILYSASANDDVELSSLNYYLRAGDKAAYEVPGFIQGLYFEGIIPPFIRQITNEAPSIFSGGATYMDIGMGLSFYDDNVKVQASYGFITQDIYEALGGEGVIRYGGNVLGIKLLANLYQLPFGALFGPDWEWLFASFSIGANFSLFDISSQGYTQSGKPTWMSALLAQVEFPRVTIPKRKFLRTFSLFTEGQLWFVPTDVDADALGISVVIPHMIVGLRLYIF